MMHSRAICALAAAMLWLAFGCLPLSAHATGKVGFIVGSGGLGDQSYNDMTMAGLLKAKDELGVELVYTEARAAKGGGDGKEEAMQQLIERGADFIVANSFEYYDLVVKYAEMHPKKRFLLNDMPVEGQPNVASTTFGQHEGSFLAGVLSALMSETGKVGLVGGTDFPIIHAFRVGFEEGVVWAKPSVQVYVAYVAEGGNPAGFGDPRTAYAISMKMIEQGADIIFAVAALSGNGVIHAARKSGKYAIGVDSNQDHMAPGRVLTSMMKRLDLSTFREIKDWKEDNFTPGVKVYGLAEKGVQLSPMEFTKEDVPDAVLAKVEEARRKILSGEITVTNYLTQ